MDNQIPTGAYVIRNKQTSSVLHIKDNPFDTWSRVFVSEQDENMHRDRQIWWIEQLPGCEGDGEEVVYSITNTPSGMGLGLRQGNGTKWFLGAGIYATNCLENGAPWQGWRIRKVQNSEGETCYTLTSVDSDYMLDIGEGDGKTYCIGQAYVAEREQQLWEFLLPKVVFPCGWFRIQNSETRGLLSHTYLSRPPVLVDPSTLIGSGPTIPSTEYREGWDTQWTLVSAQSYAPKTPCKTGTNTWCIRNRLTKGFLGNTTCEAGGTSKLKITAWEPRLTIGTEFKKGINAAEYTWKFELDTEHNWKIINHRTSYLLEHAQASGGGTEVACVNKKVTLNKSWALISSAAMPLDEVHVRPAVRPSGLAGGQS